MKIVHDSDISATPEGPALPALVSRDCNPFSVTFTHEANAVISEILWIKNYKTCSHWIVFSNRALHSIQNHN